MVPRIKIYTRSANIELYHYAKKLFPTKYKAKRLTGTESDEYLIKVIQDTTCDIAINIDEDAFVIDDNALESLIQYTIDNDIVCCGMNDGGVLPIRVANPLVIQPFFNVINTKAIRKKLDLSAIKNFNYTEHKDTLLQLLPEALRDNPGIEKMDSEPYYNLCFWMLLNFKTEYLPVSEYGDGYTTIQENQTNEPILYHTWYSRAYTDEAFHHDRIAKVIADAYSKKGLRPSLPCHIRILRLIEHRQQKFSIWWTWWTRLGFGNWIIRHAKKKPSHYIDALKRRCWHK